MGQGVNEVGAIGEEQPWDLGRDHLVLLEDLQGGPEDQGQPGGPGAGQGTNNIP